jgi:hypothetical protein
MGSGKLDGLLSSGAAKPFLLGEAPKMGSVFYGQDLAMCGGIGAAGGLDSTNG